MNDEELELDLFGNQENEEGDTTLDADISNIMENIRRSIRDTTYVFNRHRPMSMTLDLERAVGYARPIDDLYTKTKIAGDMYMKYKNDSGCFQIEKIREETMHSSPRKMFRYINSSGHRDTISVSKNFEDALGGLRIEDNLDRYKEIVEDAINVINILSSTNDRLYMNFNMTNSALSASKESVRDLNNQLATVKMNFDKLMAFTRK